jgi:hypothetical protein
MAKKQYEPDPEPDSPENLLYLPWATPADMAEELASRPHAQFFFAYKLPDGQWKVRYNTTFDEPHLAQLMFAYISILLEAKREKEKGAE